MSEEGSKSRGSPLQPIYDALWAMRQGGLDEKAESYTAEKIILTDRLAWAASTLEREFRQSAAVATRLEPLFLRERHPVTTIVHSALQQAINQDAEYAPDLPIQNTVDGLVVYGLGTLRSENWGIHHSNASMSSSRVGGCYLELAELYGQLFVQCAAGTIPQKPAQIRTLINRIETIWQQQGLVG